MEVYEFNKSTLTRHKEMTQVLEWANAPVPASEVIRQWAYFIELQIEPTGWHAIWKIPRVICEEMKFRYPTVVFGRIERVIFNELKAILHVLGVEDDDISLPENQEVLLEDLWVMKKQPEIALNVEATADCIDQLRFFYKNIWMPWDDDNDDDDLDWVKKHLNSRLKFYEDLNKNVIKKSVTAHIRNLLIEARYIRKRCDRLEMALSDDEVDEIDNANNISKDQITDLMKFHLRMSVIKSEIELLENPEMRKVYEDMQLDKKRLLLNSSIIDKNNLQSLKYDTNTKIVFIVSVLSSINEQLELLNKAKEIIDNDSKVIIINSLQDAIDFCNDNDQILLSPGEHYVKTMQTISNCCIKGLILQMRNSEKSVIKSNDDGIILLTLDGKTILENVIVDCRNVRNGIVVKNDQNVIIKNCELIGDHISSTQKGICLTGNSVLTLENCKIRNFSIGLSIVNNSEVILLNQNQIYHCKIGIELDDDTRIRFNETKDSKFCEIKYSEQYAIWFETKYFNKECNEKKIITSSQNDDKFKLMLSRPTPWSGFCTFEGNKKGNIIVWNRNLRYYSFPMINNYEFDNVKALHGDDFDLHSMSDESENDSMDD